MFSKAFILRYHNQMIGTLFILAACLLWGMDTLIRYPLVERGLNPITIVFYEHLVLSLIFSTTLIPAIKRIGNLRLSDVLGFIIVGGVGSALATVCFTESFKYLNPSLVILLQKFQPVVAIFLSAIVLKEKIQKPFLFWSAICLVGGTLVSSPDLINFWNLIMNGNGIASSDGAIHGYLLVMISVIGWGAATVFGKHLSSGGFDTKAIMGGRFLTGLVVLIPFIHFNQSIILNEVTDYSKILLMVFISGGCAMWFYYKGLKLIPARSAAISEMFFPLFAIILNWIFLGKELNQWQLVGGGLLILGSLIIQLKRY